MAAASCADIRGLPRACQEGRGRVQRLFVLLVAGFSAVPTLVFVRPASFLGAAFEIEAQGIAAAFQAGLAPRGIVGMKNAFLGGFIESADGPPHFLAGQAQRVANGGTASTRDKRLDG